MTLETILLYICIVAKVASIPALGVLLTFAWIKFCDAHFPGGAK